MEAFIKKNINLIIALFLLMSPFIDLATGVCLHYFQINLTIGIILRVIFLISMCIIALFIYKRKELLPAYMAIILFMILHLIGVFVYKNGVGLFTEVQNLVKVFYFPILFLSFYSIREEIHTSKLTLFTVLFLYLFLIFVPTVLQIGYKTYEITKSGTLGFFNSANEISGIISLLTPILFYVLSTSRKIFPKILLMAMYLIVILMMGTKTPLLSFCITVGLSLSYYWVMCIKKKKYKPIAYSLGAVIVGVTALCLILPRTNFYKNIEVHLEFLKINSIHEVFEHKETIDHFIFSQRLTFFHNKALIYKEAPLYEKLFGIGYLRNGQEIKQIEMDYFDIYYNYGIIGFILFFGISLYVLYKILEKKPTKDYERFMTEASVLLIFFLAFFTGHILTTPSVGIICILIMISLNKNKVKQVIIIREKDSKDLIKDLEDNYCYVTTTKIKKGKLYYLWFKIINYKVYDLALCDEDYLEYGEVSSKKQLIYVERKKKEEKRRKVVNKKDLLESIDYYLKKER